MGQAADGSDREFMRFSPLQLFSPALRFNTFVGLLFCVGTLLSIWTSQIWLPTIQSLMLQKEGLDRGPYAQEVHGFSHLSVTANELQMRHLDASGRFLFGLTRDRAGKVRELSV